MADNWIKKKKKIQKEIDTLVTQGGLSKKEAIEYYKEKYPEHFWSPKKKGGSVKTSKYSKGGGVRSAKYKI